jgi:hypothetical protein
MPYYKRRLRRMFLAPNTSTSLQTILANNNNNNEQVTHTFVCHINSAAFFSSAWVKVRPNSRFNCLKVWGPHWEWLRDYVGLDPLETSNADLSYPRQGVAMQRRQILNYSHEHPSITAVTVSGFWYECNRVFKTPQLGSAPGAWTDSNVLTVAVMKTSIFLNVMLCSLTRGSPGFGGIRLNLQDRRVNVSEQTSRHKQQWEISDPEDGGSKILRNICKLLPAYTKLHPIHLQGRITSQERNPHEAVSKQRNALMYSSTLKMEVTCSSERSVEF